MPWRITKLAQFVRAHNAARATGVGAVESPRWWEMYFSQSLTSSAQDLLHRAGRLDRLPTARRRNSLRSHRTAMLNNVMTSRCSRHPAARRAPRVCLAAADDASQRHRRIGQRVRTIVVIPTAGLAVLDQCQTFGARTAATFSFRLDGRSSFSVRRSRRFDIRGRPALSPPCRRRAHIGTPVGREGDFNGARHADNMAGMRRAARHHLRPCKS